MLDTLLVVRGETAPAFRLGIGVDLPHPAAAAIELLAAPARAFRNGSAGHERHAAGSFTPARRTSWPRTGSRSSMTPWRRQRPDDPTRSRDFACGCWRSPARPAACRCGRFASLAYARQVDFLGETILELYVDDDKIMLDFGPYELLEIEALWIR